MGRIVKFGERSGDEGERGEMRFGWEELCGSKIIL